MLLPVWDLRQVVWNVITPSEEGITSEKCVAKRGRQSGQPTALVDQPAKCTLVAG